MVNVMFDACCFLAHHGLVIERGEIVDGQAAKYGMPLLDYSAALRWYRLAITPRVIGGRPYVQPEGQLRIGTMYYDGRGVLQDRAEAAKW